MKFNILPLASEHLLSIVSGQHGNILNKWYIHGVGTRHRYVKYRL